MLTLNVTVSPKRGAVAAANGVAPAETTTGELIDEDDLLNPPLLPAKAVPASARTATRDDASAVLCTIWGFLSVRHRQPGSHRLVSIWDRHPTPILKSL